MTILRILFLNPLGPALILTLGGLIAMLGRRQTYRMLLRPGSYGLHPDSAAALKPVLVRFRAPLALLILTAAAAVLLALRSSLTAVVVHWSWQPLTVAGSMLEWRLDGWSWLVCGLILVLAGVALLLAPHRLTAPASSNETAARRSPRLDQQGIEWERTFWLAAAAMVFVCSSNVLTLASSWVLLDAALSYRLRPSVNRDLAGRVWGLLSLAVALLVLALTLLGESGIRTTLADLGNDRLVLALLWLLALIRAGVYPLHFWLNGSGRIEQCEAIALSLIAPLTGVWLLVRLHGSAGPDWLRRPEWAALGALALLGTALVAWAAEDELHRWRWIALNRVSVVVMAAYTAGGSGPEALTWPVVALALGCALLALAQRLAEQGWRAPAWLAALALWGLPGTTGFLARTALVFPTELPVAVPLFGLVLLAEILFVAALWQVASHRAERPRERGQSVALWAVFAVLLAVTVVLGLLPRLLSALAGWMPTDAFPLFEALIAGARRSVWAGLIGSGIAGALLGMLRARIFDQMRGWQRGIVLVASLEWVYQAVAHGFGLVASGLQYFAVLGEGEGYLGWLALASLILWVLLRG